MAHNPDATRRPNVTAALLRRLIIEERGQDLIEYALIAGLFGIVGVLVLQAIQAAIAGTYTIWLDPTVGTPSLWDPADPISSGT